MEFELMAFELVVGDWAKRHATKLVRIGTSINISGHAINSH